MTVADFLSKKVRSKPGFRKNREKKFAPPGERALWFTTVRSELCQEKTRLPPGRIGENRGKVHYFFNVLPGEREIWNRFPGWALTSPGWALFFLSLRTVEHKTVVLKTKCQSRKIPWVVRTLFSHPWRRWKNGKNAKVNFPGWRWPPILSPGGSLTKISSFCEFFKLCFFCTFFSPGDGGFAKFGRFPPGDSPVFLKHHRVAVATVTATRGNFSNFAFKVKKWASLFFNAPPGHSHFACWAAPWRALFCLKSYKIQIVKFWIFAPGWALLLDCFQAMKNRAF